MPNDIKPLRSFVPNLIPLANEIAEGELAVNWNDGRLFTKDAEGNIVVHEIGGTVASGGGGGGSVAEAASTAAFPATGASSTLYIATDVGRLFRWTGIAYAEIGPISGGGGDDARWDYFKPAAPTGVTATAGNAQAEVSWTAPAIVVPPLTDYSVQYSTDGGTTWTTASDAVSTAASATITSLTNGVAHVFRVAGINGIGTGSYSTASVAVTPGTDPLFSSVSLLLPFDGTGNTFVDSSATPKTITAVGNATQSATESQWGGKSAYFDGSGDYVTIAGSALNLSSSDFVIEMWIRTTQTALYATVAAKGSTSWGAGYWGFMINHGSADGSLAVYVNNHNAGGPLMVTTGASVIDGNWHHIAWVRSGTAHALYVDGTRRATATASFTIATLSENISIGGDVLFGDRWFDGYIDDFRATVGNNRGYTGATITVPTAAFPTS